MTRELSSRVRRLIPALFMGLSALVAPTDTTAQGVLPEVVSVDFVGNATFPRDSLQRAIATSQTECRSWMLKWLFPVCPLFGWGERRALLRERDVTLDVQRIARWYQVRGFREVSVTAETDLRVEGAVDEDGRIARRRTSGRPPRRTELRDDPSANQEVAEVVFTIEEGRPIQADSIGYVSPDGFAAGDLLDDLPIDAGDRWSTLALDATRDTLIRRLRNRGYPYADVLRQTSLPQEEPYHAHVTFEIEPGPSSVYGQIRVSGVDRLDERTVLRTLPFETGQPFQADQLIEGQARLFGLEIIRNARVEADTMVARQQALPDSIVPLFVEVTEGDPYRVRAGAGWNTAECFNTEARWTNRNFIGGGRVLQLRGRLANIVAQDFSACSQSGEGEFAELTWLTAVDFSQPWILSTRNSFNASLFAERQSVPDIFIRRAIGLDLSLVRSLAPRTALTLRYSPELSTLEAAEVLLCTGFLVCRSEDIDVLTGVQRIAPVGINITRDLANSLLNPTRGYRLVLDLEHAARWTASEYRYNRAVVEGTWYSPLTGRVVLGARVRGGWVGWGEFYGGMTPLQTVHPQRRFYAGGANSVRGFGQSRLGPRVLAVDNPARLLETPADGGAGCSPGEIMALSCDATLLQTRFITSRPIGGTRVVEGNLEVRVSLAREFQVVAFGDFGQVWDADTHLDLGDLEFTPGFGVRYLSPIGPIRLDLGYSSRGSEELSVVTQQIEASTCDPDPDVRDGCLRVNEVKIPYTATGELATLPSIQFGEEGSWWRRFQLHLSIGQAF